MLNSHVDLLMEGWRDWPIGDLFVETEIFYAEQSCRSVDGRMERIAYWGIICRNRDF